MSAPAAAPAPAKSGPPPLPVAIHDMIAAMLSAAPGVSDLILSPGRPPQVESSGKLVPVNIPLLPMLKPEHTARLAMEIIGSHRIALQSLKDNGSCDLSYSVPGKSRFRVNVFQQRGSYAPVMRVIPSKIPTFEELNLPAELKSIVPPGRWQRLDSPSGDHRIVSPCHLINFRRICNESARIIGGHERSCRCTVLTLTPFGRID